MDGQTWGISADDRQNNSPHHSTIPPLLFDLQSDIQLRRIQGRTSAVPCSVRTIDGSRFLPVVPAKLSSSSSLSICVVTIGDEKASVSTFFTSSLMKPSIGMSALNTSLAEHFSRLLVYV